MDPAGNTFSQEEDFNNNNNNNDNNKTDVDDDEDVRIMMTQNSINNNNNIEAAATSTGVAIVASGGSSGGGGADGDDNDDDNTNNNYIPGETDEEREQRLKREEEAWTYIPPPNSSKGTFVFYENENSTKQFCTFTSDFDSGNLARVDRTGPTKFDLHIANDCMGGQPGCTTNNKMWFYFAVTGVPLGTTLTFTLCQVPFVKTYTYGYTPVVAVDPTPSSVLAAACSSSTATTPTAATVDGGIISALSQQQQQPQPKPITTLLASKSFNRIPGPAVTITPAPIPAHIAAAQKEKELKKVAEQQRMMEEQDVNANNTSSNTPVTPTVTNNVKTPTTTAKKTKSGGGGGGANATAANPQYCHITFDYTFDINMKPFLSNKQEMMMNGSSNNNNSAASILQNTPFTYYFAFGHPYSYEKLQRHLSVWHTANGPNNQKKVQALVEAQLGGGGGGNNSATTIGSGSPPSFALNREITKLTNKLSHPVMYRELLTKTLDGNRIDMITITGRDRPPSPSSTSSSTTAIANDDIASNFEAFFGPEDEQLGRKKFPILNEESSSPSSSPTTSLLITTPQTHRIVPTNFPKHRKYVLLSARVHPGEVPASHVMHGCIEYLLNTDDPRAAALRDNFIFVIVPMVNPDGVVRGNTRADSVGCNLNRMYKDPSPKRHPSIFALRHLMLHLANSERGLALYVDMHAHANKKGAFFYGNAMEADKQIENLLWAKLVSLNSPYLGFTDCNFTNTNMFTLGKTGICRDGSSRVNLFMETGLIHSYTLECNSVIGPNCNGVIGLASSSSSSGSNNINTSSLMMSASSSSSAHLPPPPPPAAVPICELDDRPPSNTCPRFTPSLVFHDIARAMLVSLLDYHQLNVNGLSRVPMLTDFNRSLQGIRGFIAAALWNDAMEQLNKRRNKFDSVMVLTKEDKTNNNNNNSQQQQSSASASSSQFSSDELVFLCGPINSIINPSRSLIPPTTTTKGMLSIQQLAQQANKNGLIATALITGGGGASSSSSFLSRRASSFTIATTTSYNTTTSTSRTSSNSNNNNSAATMKRSGIAKKPLHQQHAATPTAIVAAVVGKKAYQTNGSENNNNNNISNNNTVLTTTTGKQRSPSVTTTSNPSTPTTQQQQHSSSSSFAGPSSPNSTTTPPSGAQPPKPKFSYLKRKLPLS